MLSLSTVKSSVGGADDIPSLVAPTLSARVKDGKSTERDEDNLSEISDDADDILNRQEEAAAAAAAAVAAASSSGIGGPTSVLFGGVTVGGHKPALLPTPAFKVGELPPRYIVPTLLPHSHPALHLQHHHGSGVGGGGGGGHHASMHQHQSTHINASSSSSSSMQHQGNLSNNLTTGTAHHSQHGHIGAGGHFGVHLAAAHKIGNALRPMIGANNKTNNTGGNKSIHSGADGLHHHGGISGNSKADKLSSKLSGMGGNNGGNGGIAADDLDLDFEEISDGELEEEARIRSLGDALGVDWASLVNESKAIARERRGVASGNAAGSRSAKQRWQPYRILLDVGVSFRRAGAEFAAGVLNAAQRQVKLDEMAATKAATNEATATASSRLKQEPKQTEEVAGAATVTRIKREIVDVEIESEVTIVSPTQTAESKDDKTATNVVAAAAEAAAAADADQKTTAASTNIKAEPDVTERLFHPIACVQVASRTSAEARKTLVLNVTGTYSRALCAERDIAMRRRLCGLSAERIASVSVPSAASELAPYAAIAKQLFETALAKVNAY